MKVGSYGQGSLSNAYLWHTWHGCVTMWRYRFYPCTNDQSLTRLVLLFGVPRYRPNRRHTCSTAHSGSRPSGQLLPQCRNRGEGDCNFVLFWTSFYRRHKVPRLSGWFQCSHWTVLCGETIEPDDGRWRHSLTASSIEPSHTYTDARRWARDDDEGYYGRAAILESGTTGLLGWMSVGSIRGGLTIVSIVVVVDEVSTTFRVEPCACDCAVWSVATV